MTEQDVFAGVVVTLVSAGLYVAFRFLPEVKPSGRSVSPYPLGKEATVLGIDQQLGGQSFQGQVRVLGETWRARLNTANAKVGDTVRIIDGERTTLVCGPLDSCATQGISDENRSHRRILGGIGRLVAALLCVILSTMSFLAFRALPLAGGLALFGLFAPLALVLALITVGSPSGGPGLTVRSLRAVIAATCGFATFLGMTVGLTPAIAPTVSALVLAAFDPSLSAIFFALVIVGDA